MAVSLMGGNKHNTYPYKCKLILLKNYFPETYIEIFSPKNCFNVFEEKLSQISRKSQKRFFCFVL